MVLNHSLLGALLDQLMEQEKTIQVIEGLKQVTPDLLRASNIYHPRLFCIGVWFDEERLVFSSMESWISWRTYGGLSHIPQTEYDMIKVRKSVVVVYNKDESTDRIQRILQALNYATVPA